MTYRAATSGARMGLCLVHLVHPVHPVYEVPLRNEKKKVGFWIAPASRLGHGVQPRGGDFPEIKWAGSRDKRQGN
jgi:hypothetical protein